MVGRDTLNGSEKALFQVEFDFGVTSATPEVKAAVTLTLQVQKRLTLER